MVSYKAYKIKFEFWPLAQIKALQGEPAGFKSVDRGLVIISRIYRSFDVFFSQLWYLREAASPARMPRKYPPSTIPWRPAARKQARVYRHSRLCFSQLSKPQAARYTLLIPFPASGELSQNAHPQQRK